MQWDLELFSLGPSSLSVRREACGRWRCVAHWRPGLGLSSRGTIGFYPGPEPQIVDLFLDCCLGRAQDEEYNQHNGGSVPQVQSGKVTVCVGF